MAVSVRDKLTALGINPKVNIPNNYIDDLYQLHIVAKNPPAIQKQIDDQVDIPHKTVDQTSSKYVILLQVVNKILTNLNKSNIINLMDFKCIDREDIIKEGNEMVMKEMEKDIYEHFDKSKCGFYRKKTTKNYILTFIRSACDDLGLNFIYKHKNIQKSKIMTTHYLYSIE